MAAFIGSNIAMFRICGKFPTGKYITVFNDVLCINQPLNFHIYALTHSCGYFLVDFYFAAWVVKGNQAIDM
jgi:hypothetical protein